MLTEFSALWLLLAFITLSILIPGFLIWVGLKVIGKKRSIVKCGFSNFAAFLITAVVSLFLHFTPFAILIPLIAFVVYFYVLKTLLDIGFIEALLATLIAGIVAFLLAFIILAIFGVWLLFIPPQIQRFSIRF